ncbi:MAG TPA: hypothetical protein VFQ13_18370 [Anaerolineales bacterium]|nr:hypothetical protein [Anaerolineales bacterium]
MQSQNGNGSCGSCIALVMFLGLVTMFVYVVAKIAIGVWDFFIEPGLLYRLVGVVVGFPICIGIIAVFLFLLSKVPESWFGNQGGDDDDYYYN